MKVKKEEAPLSTKIKSEKLSFIIRPNPTTGRQMALLLNEEWQEAGNHQLEYQAGELPAGIYVLMMQVGDQQISRRMVRIN